MWDGGVEFCVSLLHPGEQGPAVTDDHLFVQQSRISCSLLLKCNRGQSGCKPRLPVGCVPKRGRKARGESKANEGTSGETGEGGKERKAE